jgi:Family of unknown function (DUF6134)
MEAQMRATRLLTIGVMILPIAAMANPATETHSFAIVRNGEQIGTNTICVHHDGPDMLVEISTSIAVKIAFLTLYRFEQTERERWADGRFVSMNSTTDDDGAMHRVSADASTGALSVTADGKTKRMAGNLMPSSLWNPVLARQASALSTVDGSLLRVAVDDRGTEDLPIGGRQISAHHYSLRSIFAQDVWYDDRGDLVRVRLRGTDGSTILYQPTPIRRPG